MPVASVRRRDVDNPSRAPQIRLQAVADAGTVETARQSIGEALSMPVASVRRRDLDNPSRAPRVSREWARLGKVLVFTRFSVVKKFRAG